MSILSVRKKDKQMLVVILMDILALELMGVFIYLLVLVIKVLQAGRDHAEGRQPAWVRTGYAIHERAARFYRLHICGDGLLTV